MPDPSNTLVVDQANLISAAVQRLAAAAHTGIACEPVRDLLGTTDIGLAYAVQQAGILARTNRGATIVGHKIGLTSVAVQQQLGVDRPDFGSLLDDMLVPADGVIDTSKLLQPKAEAEIAFVLEHDLDGELTLDRVRAAVAYAVASLEIVDSRIRAWDITITDTVADNASSGMFVLGTERFALDTFEPRDVSMSMSKDSVVVSTGDGAACLGDPLNALLWLATSAQDYGAALRAGDVVLSGALGPMIAVEPGSQVVAEFSVLGRVSASFSKGNAL